jgi:ribonuclease P protein component
MMSGHINTFKKEERLKGIIAVNNLFDMGKSRLVYPIKIVYLEKEQNSDSHNKAAFTISKKNFKNAVDRNLLKRRMREAYRLNKNQFFQNLNGKSFDVAFIYVANEILPYPTIENSIKVILARLVK